MDKELQALLNGAIEIRKREELIPIVFVLSEEKMEAVIQLPFANDKEKQQMYLEAGKRCGEKFGIPKYIVLINDIAMREISKEDSEYVKENYDTEAPLTYPPNMREDGIMMLAISFINSVPSCLGYVQKYKFKGSDIELGVQAKMDEVNIKESFLVRCVLTGFLQGLMKRNHEQSNN